MDVAYLKALSSYSPGGTEKNHEKSQHNRFLGQDSIQALPEYKSKPLLLQQNADFSLVVVLSWDSA
jgi:hypothetical protein